MQLDCGLKQKTLHPLLVRDIRQRVKGYRVGDVHRKEVPAFARTSNRKAHAKLGRRLHAYLNPFSEKRGVNDRGERKPGSLQFH